MSFKKILPWVTVIVFLITVGYLLSSKGIVFQKKILTNDIKYVKIAGQILKVDVASTKESQREGLSNRNILKDDEGMLFVFEDSGKYSFWMKNMNFPIDIIWIGEDSSVVYIKKDAQPESYPEVFTPTENAAYVLEVISGFAEKNNLKGGEKVKFLP